MSKPPINKHRRGGCALCGAPIVAEHRPFCSQGCRDRDLLQWLGDGYRVPGPVVDSEGREIDEDGLDN